MGTAVCVHMLVELCLIRDKRICMYAVCTSSSNHLIGLCLCTGCLYLETCYGEKKCFQGREDIYISVIICLERDIKYTKKDLRAFQGVIFLVIF